VWTSARGDRLTNPGFSTREGPHTATSFTGSLVIAARCALSRRVSRFFRPHGVRNRHELAYSSQTCVIGAFVVIVAILRALAFGHTARAATPSQPTSAGRSTTATVARRLTAPNQWHDAQRTNT